MNGSEPKIEIFTPFGQAYELMTKILFRPFELRKWLVIGFAAFLASFSAGFHFNWNPVSTWSERKDRQTLRESLRDIGPIDQLSPWIITASAIGIVIAIGIVLALVWIGSRGRFIFTDCIVHNRGAIVAPWKEFRREGNSFFLFSLLVGLVMLALIAAAVLPLLVPAIIGQSEASPAIGFWIVFSLLILFVILLGLSWALVSQLMVPVMYRERCLAGEGLRKAIGLITAYPGPILLYFLFFFMLIIAAAMISCLATCVTCCIAAIPYLGAVILLPVSVTLYGFTLMFLRQFGPEYDVWAGALPASQIPLSPNEPLRPPGEPPVQT